MKFLFRLVEIKILEKSGNRFPLVIQNDWKLQTVSQGYIHRILQHFATKLWNITNFVITFQAVMKFCLDLLSSKFWLIGDWSIVEGICRWQFRDVFFIHLLDLTRSSCEKCNYRPSGRNRTCGPVRFRCSAIYCSVTWGNCSKTLLLRILRLQKRAARIILDADFSTPSVLLFSQIRIIPIFDLVKFRKLLLLINILTNPSAPSSV
jgi:hypothetical protein